MLLVQKVQKQQPLLKSPTIQRITATKIRAVHVWTEIPTLCAIADLSVFSQECIVNYI
jgi:hypothetical protein